MSKVKITEVQEVYRVFKEMLEKRALRLCDVPNEKYEEIGLAQIRKEPKVAAQYLEWLCGRGFHNVSAADMPAARIARGNDQRMADLVFRNAQFEVIDFLADIKLEMIAGPVDLDAIKRRVRAFGFPETRAWMKTEAA